eukprot:GHVS01082027.1.p1 GENE.GHVS01082027.1~~GHVS01082027.1.p1  ORF type:complete len:333 (-),score=52.35 GHVS01082027.1:96-1094(-)
MSAPSLCSRSVVLVTGGSGLLGHGLCHAVQTEKEQLEGGEAKFVWLSSKDGDLRCYDSMKKVFELHKPTHVVHLAARVGGVFANMADNLGFFRENTLMNDTILRLSHEYNVQRAVFCLSTCVFPAEAPLPLTEESLHNGPPHFSNEGYATAKRNLEMLVRFYREQYKHDWICVIPTNLYGPYDNFNLKESHVLPALIHKCFVAKKEGGDLLVAGSGKPLRQFLFSYDAGDIILALLKHRTKFEDHNMILCGDENVGEHSIKAVAESIVKAMGHAGGVKFDTSKAEGIFKKTASNAKLRKFVGVDYRFTPLDEGVAVTAKWFEENYDQHIMRK